MSKLKLSFSFLLMLVLVGMFSVVAFAAGSTQPSPVNGGTVLGTDISKAGNGGLVSDDQGNDNKYNTVDRSNANRTGSGVGGSTANYDQVIKATKNSDGTTQRTHGSYMNNTNSCASCHQTHTGASESLLFKDGRFQTCTACHDGTLGFYNVFASGDQASSDDMITGYTGNGFDNSAGTFGGNTDGNMSVHLANGTVQMTAAPGGNRTGTGNWAEDFSCASCHAPHGSYSDRLLNENPNDMANTPISEGGQKIVGFPVVDKTTYTDATFKTKYAPADQTYTIASGSQTANYIIYRFQIGDTGSPVPTNADYATKGLKTGDYVLQVMKWDPTANSNAGGYVVDKAPWMHGYDFDTAHKKHDWTFLQNDTVKWVASTTDPGYNATLKNNTTDSDFVGKPFELIDTDKLQNGEVLGTGYAAFPTATTDAATLTNVQGLTKGNIARAYVVKLDITASSDAALAKENVKVTKVSTLWTAQAGSANSGKGVAMSAFCASCHTDYLAQSAGGKDTAPATGTFDTAYRHTTTSDSYTCVRCHYPHGTDLTVMRDARGLTYKQILADTTDYPFTGATDRTQAVKDYLLDKNPSSALKRYTNMAVCWGCHTSSHSEGTRNTDTYQYSPTPGVDTDRNGIGSSVGGGTINAGY